MALAASNVEYSGMKCFLNGVFECGPLREQGVVVEEVLWLLCVTLR
jgi:hypothetical protein